jgi:hypothetical protein
MVHALVITVVFFASLVFANAQSIIGGPQGTTVMATNNGINNRSILTARGDLSFPVTYFHATANAFGGYIAHDILPSGTPSSNALLGAGVAWVDVCNTDNPITGVNGSSYSCARQGAATGYIVLGSIGGSQEFGSGSALPLFVNPYGGVKTCLNCMAGTDTPSSALDVKGVTGISGYPPLRFSDAGNTVATLPACTTSLKGAWDYVTDALSPTYNGALVGSGIVTVPVFCNGTAWTAH